MRNFIFGVILTSLFSFSMYQYFQSQSLISQVNTLKNNITSNNENLQKIKESYYIEQQNRDTTLILFTVTALFTIFSFFTFTSVKRMFDVKVTEIKDKYNEQVAETQKVIIHIKNLEGDLSFETAKNMSSSFNLFKLEYTNDELIEVFELALVSCEYYSKSLIYKSDKSLLFENAVKTILKSSLERLKELAEDSGTVSLKTISFNRFASIKSNLERAITKEDSVNLSYIVSKLSFPTSA